LNTPATRAEFARFVSTGLLVAFMAMLLREFVAMFLPATAFAFALSILFVYFFGIICSFFLHHEFTFRSAGLGRLSSVRFLKFAAVSAGLGISNVLISSAIRFLLIHRSNFSIGFSDWLAFTTAVVITSIASYVIQRRFIFSN
jgi:putative flippase GtrA